ncbi:LysR family transcriptional regulator [Granulosicoccus sp. 3-233]|uniref:LysR family transcriptional regulator n=1 Tax=Granulosicoccus sp. 3-233 TaxID=3417969 RepID=UPI003D34E088
MDRKANWSWDNLRHFLAVAQHGTLSAAARVLGVSHSTVQRRIGILEQELQTSLFCRTNNGFRLTASGKALFGEALRLQTTLESISRNVAGSDADVKGRVVLTSTDTLCFSILPAMIMSLAQTYPRLSIELDMINTFSDMQNLEADIAIRSCEEPPDNLIGRRIGSVRFLACAAHAYCHDTGLSSFPSNVEAHHFIVLNDYYNTTPFHQWLTERLTRDTRTTIASGFLSAYGLCRAGLGITLLPSYMVDDSHDLMVLDVDGIPESHDLWILSHRDLRTTQSVRVVRQYLYQELSRLFAGTD